MGRWVCKRYTVVALLWLCIGAGGGGGPLLAWGSPASPFWMEASPGQTPPLPVPDFAELAAQRTPAVVNISTTQITPGERRRPPGLHFPRPFGGRDPFEEFFERFFGGPTPEREPRRRSLGSGVLINKDGHILTNNHVVENATDIRVSLSDEEEFTARIVGRDPKTDVALIKIEARRELPVAPLGDSDALRVGEWVVAIGNPFGLGHTVTIGIASAKGRTIGAGPYDDFIQTDASINPGNSGGPLFNIRGDVVGINTAIVATGQGIGFAIPINLAKGVMPQLHAGGKVIRGWLGVQVQRMTPSLAQSVGLEHPRGALVAEVQPNSPAARAGLRQSDVIVEFNGRKIDDTSALPLVVANTAPGTVVNVTFLRNGRRQVVQLTVGELREEQQEATLRGDSPEGKLGLAVQELTPDSSRMRGLFKTPGVVVTEVERGSPAAESGLQQGDVILEVNQQPVTNLQDYHAALNNAGQEPVVLFLIQRGDNTVYITWRPAG